MANPRYIPVSVTISKEQETELFKEFSPVFAMVSAACANIAKKQDFTKFAYLAKALDVLLNTAYESMVWPD